MPSERAYPVMDDLDYSKDSYRRCTKVRNRFLFAQEKLEYLIIQSGQFFMAKIREDRH